MSAHPSSPLISSDPNLDPLVVLTTMPEVAAAHALAKILLQAQVAACVQVLPGMVSHYQWQGVLNEEAECLVLIKTLRCRFRALEATLKKNHPYELPEILALAAEDWSQGYGAWMGQQVGPDGPS